MPSTRPDGTDMPGMPAMLAGSVSTSLRYIFTGSWVRSPNLNATDGEVAMTSGVVAVSSGSLHSCAVTTSGGVKCWGENCCGLLGDGTASLRATPVDVVGFTTR